MNTAVPVAIWRKNTAKEPSLLTLLVNATSVHEKSYGNLPAPKDCTTGL